MTPKTIVVDARMLGAAGIGTVISNLLPGLIGQRPAWRFRIVAPDSALQDMPWARAGNVERIPFAAPIHSIDEQRRWPYPQAAGSDLLLAPNYNIPVRWRGRLLTIVHDMAHLALPKIFGGPAKQIYARVLFRAVWLKSTAIVFDSKFSQAEFRRLIGKPRSEYVIYPGVGRSWFEASCPRREPVPYIAFVGNVKPHKNLRRLLEAFLQIRDRIPHRLVIVGRREGFITPDLSLGPFEGRLGERLRFSGKLPLDRLQTLVAGADALVYPSLYEGFGLPPLEAMAAGCPAVVARSASIPEVCGDAAHYCEPLDASDIARAILEALADNELRHRLRSAGRVRAAMFSWDATVGQYAAAIEAVLATPRR